MQRILGSLTPCTIIIIIFLNNYECVLYKNNISEQNFFDNIKIAIIKIEKEILVGSSYLSRWGWTFSHNAFIHKHTNKHLYDEEIILKLTKILLAYMKFNFHKSN